MEHAPVGTVTPMPPPGLERLHQPHSDQASHQTASAGQRCDSVPERRGVWEQEVPACSGVSAGQRPLQVPAALARRAAPRCSCSHWRRQMAAACLFGALELAGEEVSMGFQGSQSPVQKIHKSQELGTSTSNHLVTLCYTFEDLHEVFEPQSRKYCLQYWLYMSSRHWLDRLGQFGIPRNGNQENRVTQVSSL